MSVLALSLIEKNLETKDSHLNLGYCGLNDQSFTKGHDLDLALRQCTHLESLTLSNQWWDRTAEKYEISYNNNTRNLFTKIPASLEGLQSLKTLICGGYLDLRWKINDLGPITNLQQLRYLYLRFNKLDDIGSLHKLTKLEILDLSFNKISSIYGISELGKLRELRLNTNQISGKCILKSLPELEIIDVGNNQIQGFEGLNELNALRQLYAQNNNIAELEDFGQLKQLQVANLFRNQISSIKFLIPLLEGSENPISINLTNEFAANKEIVLNENPLTAPPPEIIKLGIRSIKKYFVSIEEQGSDYLYEAKMLIVGQPRAGKTTLRHKLLNSQAPLPREEDTTKGISVSRLDFTIIDNEELERIFFYNVWDFGGQHIYQTTHQFFLTSRSLYALVIDAARDTIGNDDNNVNYWLQIIELLGKNSPVFLIVNEKSDRAVSVDLIKKRSRFPFLKGYYKVDLNALIQGIPSFREKRLREFRHMVDDIENELKHLPLVGILMPKNWVKIRKEIQSLSRSKHYIYKQEYIDICRRNGIFDDFSQMELSQIFHDLGIFLHFQEYPQLEDIVVLQNNWATDAVFMVLDHPKIKSSMGLFDDSDIYQIWKDNYDRSLHRKLLSLMMQFKLCYQVPGMGEPKYRVPEMLPEAPPADYVSLSGRIIQIHYNYEFMPKGILTRFIVRVHRFINEQNGQQEVWKTGVKIRGASMDCPNTLAEVCEDWDGKRLLVNVGGPFTRELMSKITALIDEINIEIFKNASNDTPLWSKIIPSNCNGCVDKSKPTDYPYNTLLSMWAHGKLTVGCMNPPYNDVSIEMLLNGVLDKPVQVQKQNSSFNPKKVFFSYSHKDEDFKKELDNHFSALKRSNKIETWHDRRIEGGEVWDKQIMAALANVEIVLLLLSPDFMASNYIWDKEIAIAKANGARIIPIFLRPCDFGETMHNISVYQGFPRDVRWILSPKYFPNRDDGYLEVVEGIKSLL